MKRRLGVFISIFLLLFGGSVFEGSFVMGYSLSEISESDRPEMSDAEGMNALSDAEGTDDVEDAEGMSAVSDAEGMNALSDAEGTDAVEDTGGADAGEETVFGDPTGGEVFLPGAQAGNPSADGPGDEKESSMPDDDSDVVNLIIPATVSIIIDPFEINGRGQVFSDTYKIQNLGHTDVVMTFTDMRCTFANEADFEPMARPFEEYGGSSRKSMYLLLDFGREDISPVVLTDSNHISEVSIPLSGANADTASSISLSFSGYVGQNLNTHWHDGDVKISLGYRIEILGQEPDEAAETLSGTLPEDEVTESMDAQGESPETTLPDLIQPEEELGEAPDGDSEGAAPADSDAQTQAIAPSGGHGQALTGETATPTDLPGPEEGSGEAPDEDSETTAPTDSTMAAGSQAFIS
jgi:hypothetical protein